MTRVLLIGGSGQLGSEIRRRWKDCEISSPSHGELEITDSVAFTRAFDSFSPNVVINCAAFHNVDRCEDEPLRAFEVNAVAVDAMAAECARRNTTFVTFSTDYVFSGETSAPYDEDAAPQPISAYGTSKFAGELLVRRRNSDALIVRTCGVYGLRPSATKGYTFVDRIIAQAKAGEAIRVVDDVVASPTYAGHLAEALKALVERRRSGLYHLVNRGAVSWYQFAKQALASAGIDHPIEGVPQSTWFTKAARPRYSALTSNRIASLGIELPDWRAGIEAYLQDKAALDVST